MVSEIVRWETVFENILHGSKQQNTNKEENYITEYYDGPGRSFRWISVETGGNLAS